MVYTCRQDNHNSVTFDNGRDEVYWTSTAPSPGTAANTHYKCPSYAAYIVEADISFIDDGIYSWWSGVPSKPSDLYVSGRLYFSQAATHEFGHALGFAHENAVLTVGESIAHKPSTNSVQRNVTPLSIEGGAANLGTAMVSRATKAPYLAMYMRAVQSPD